MTEEQILKVLKLINAENIKKKDDWIMCSCPFAEWTHEKKKDTNPSFGISIGNSVFNCFSCGVKGSMGIFPNMLSYYAKENFNFLFEYITDEILYVFEKKIQQEIMPAIPTEFIEKNFEILSFEWKHITPEMSLKYSIFYDKWRDLIVFPITDRKGVIKALTGRGRTDKKIMYNYKKELPLNRAYKKGGAWYGLNFLNNNNKLYLVEGQRDMLFLHNYGVGNVLASLGVNLTQNQLRTIKTIPNITEIVLFFDNDKAGERAKRQVINEFKGLYKLYEIADYRGCKDPAELVETNTIKEALQTVTMIGGFYE